MSASATLADRADALEEQKIRELDVLVLPSALFTMVDGVRHDGAGAKLVAANPGKYMLMGDDPRLPNMPAKPTLVDFFKLRFGGAQHLLQSAHHALKAGYDEKVVIACLLHDIAVVGFIRGDHGYWGAQLIAPYVDEEVAFAVRYHQPLRFFADPAVGYEYPEAYVRFFGADYVPPDYIRRDYEEARRHRWYPSARTITLYDLYSFEEGLGFDNSPTAHMWRTMIWPRNFL